MEYKVVMPQLTDTMEEGKIIRWLKKEGDLVKKDEPLVEIESDKAVIEVPSMRDGVLVKILAEEGEELPVGATIAVIETELEKAKVTAKKVEQPPAKKEGKKEEIKIPEKIPAKKEMLPEGTASPSARRVAAQLDINIKKLQEEGKLPVPAHERDVKNYFYNRFFTKSALELIERYGLTAEEVYRVIKKEKIDKRTVEQYIKEKNIPEVSAPSDVQQILIKNLSKSVYIPVYHITHQFDVEEILKAEDYTFTTYLIKILGDVMVAHPEVRTVYREGSFYTYPASNISVAIAVGKELFNPTVKSVEEKSLKEIYQELQRLKEKAERKKLTVEDIQGATFSISNLGMYGIKQFDAVIPPFHSCIAAVGAAVNGIVTVTFTFDHRVINGAQAAQFVIDVERRFKDRRYIKSIR